MKLSKEEKGRIRAEEIFREEVRAEIARRKGRGARGKISDFLNSSFGIWFLSSIVLTSITWFFTTYAATQARHERLLDLEQEIQEHLWEFEGDVRYYWSWDDYCYAFKTRLQRPTYKFVANENRTMEEMLTIYARQGGDAEHRRRALAVSDGIDGIWDDINKEFANRPHYALDNDDKTELDKAIAGTIRKFGLDSVMPPFKQTSP